MFMEKAMELLDSAIARHKRHMNGTEKTDEASQQKLMDEIVEARAQLAACMMESKQSGMGGMSMKSAMGDVTISQDGNMTTYTIVPASKLAVKAVGDWELDVTPVPFGSTNNRDSDGQWFDHTTEIMEEVYDKPLVIYQHGIEQGGKAYQGKLVVVGKSIPGTL